MWFWKKQVYTPLEAAILELLVRQMPDELASVLRSQIQEMSKSLRLPPNDCEIEYWPKGNMCSRYFPTKAEELKFARLKFLDRPSGAEYTAEFWIVNSRFFQINLRPGIKAIQKHTDVELKWCKLLADPMQESSEMRPGASTKADKPPDKEALAKWLGPLPEKTTIEEVSPPATAEQIEAIRMMSPCFPRDYVEMLRVSNGYLLTSLTVCGTEDIYLVDVESGSKYLLASGNMSMLVVSNEAPCRGVELLDLQGEDSEPISPDFHTALWRLINEQARFR